MPKDFCGTWNKRKAEQVLAAECQVLLLSGYDPWDGVKPWHDGWSRKPPTLSLASLSSPLIPVPLGCSGKVILLQRIFAESLVTGCWGRQETFKMEHGTWSEQRVLVTWDVGRHSPGSVALSCKLLKMSQESKLDIRDNHLIDLKKGQRTDESATSLATVRFSWRSQPWRAFIDPVICI